MNNRDEIKQLVIDSISKDDVVLQYKDEIFQKDCSRVEYIRGYLAAIKDIEDGVIEIQVSKGAAFAD